MVEDAAHAIGASWKGRRIGTFGDMVYFSFHAAGKANFADVNAAIGLTQLPRLDALNARRRMLADHYFERLRGCTPLRLPARGDDAIHLFAAYRELGYRPGQFANAERIGRETVTLPLFPAMTPEDVDRVVDAVPLALHEAQQ